VVAPPPVAPVVKTVTVEKTPVWMLWFPIFLLLVLLAMCFVIYQMQRRRQWLELQVKTLYVREQQRHSAELSARARRKEEAGIRERELTADPVTSGPAFVAEPSVPTPVVVEPTASVTKVAPVPAPIATDGVEFVPTPTPVAPVTASAKKFISFVPVNANGPAMVRWNGVNFHRIDVESDGTYVIRFTPFK
jgi:hypothetical protein